MSDFQPPKINSPEFFGLEPGSEEYETFLGAAVEPESRSDIDNLSDVLEDGSNWQRGEQA